ncbi:MAG: hypothetical protein Q4E06_05725, partial [Lautropia sp.]|nr:hypothetical protein [Lautropia sp.]
AADKAAAEARMRAAEQAAREATAARNAAEEAARTNADAAAQATAAATAANAQAAADRAAAEQAEAQRQAAVAAAAEADAARRAIEEKANADRLAAEKEAAEKAAAEAAAAQKAAEERAVAEAAAARKAAEEKAAAEKAAADKAAADKAAAEAAEKARQAEAEAEAKRKAEEEAKQKAEAEAKKAEEDEAKRQADEAAKQDEARNRQPLAGPTDPWGPGGVNGAVLATMLDQHTDSAGSGAERQAAALAYPNDASRAPTISSTQTRNVPYSGQSNYGGILGNYSPVEGHFVYTTFNGTSQGEGTNGGFQPNSIGMDVALIRTATEITFPVQVQALDVNGGNYKDGPLYTASSTRVLGATERFMFGHVVQEWKGENNTSIKLQLETSGQNQAYLCWDFSLPSTTRRYCNHWQVPDGWEAGKPLQYLGYYVTDQTAEGPITWRSR